MSTFIKKIKFRNYKRFVSYRIEPNPKINILLFIYKFFYLFTLAVKKSIPISNFPFS